jgi:ABC-type uncharacterized transport system substrate-binding protein
VTGQPFLGYPVKRQCGVMRHERNISKILKGTKPAELPVDESAKFEFVFNLKAARALGIELPLSLMMQVSETIE